MFRRQIDKATGGSDCPARAASMSFANALRKVRGREAVRAHLRRKSWQASDKFRTGVTNSASRRFARGVIEVLAKLLIGQLNALEPLFGLEALAQVALKAIRVPELGRGTIGLVNRGLRVAAARTMPKHSEMSKTGSADARPFVCSLSRRQGIAIPAQLVEQLLRLIALLLQPSTMCAGAFGGEPGIVQLPFGSWR